MCTADSGHCLSTTATNLNVTLFDKRPKDGFSRNIAGCRGCECDLAVVPVGSVSFKSIEESCRAFMFIPCFNCHRSFFFVYLAQLVDRRGPRHFAAALSGPRPIGSQGQVHVLGVSGGPVPRMRPAELSFYRVLGELSQREAERGFRGYGSPL